jgi:hypothetical protein
VRDEEIDRIDAFVGEPGVFATIMRSQVQDTRWIGMIAMAVSGTIVRDSRRSEVVQDSRTQRNRSCH